MAQKINIVQTQSNLYIEKLLLEDEETKLQDGDE
jgi:hypothetical protein